MTNCNRCPRCGGIAHHFVTDIAGRPYYRCMAGLTTMRNEAGDMVRSGNILPCETIIDSTGTVVVSKESPESKVVRIPYNVTYYSGNKLRINIETVGVINGRMN